MTTPTDKTTATTSTANNSYEWSDCGFTWTRDKIKKFVMGNKFQTSDVMISLEIYAILTFVSFPIASLLESITRGQATSCPYGEYDMPTFDKLVHSWSFVVVVAAIVGKCIETRNLPATRFVLIASYILGIMAYGFFILLFNQKHCLMHRGLSIGQNSLQSIRKKVFPNLEKTEDEKLTEHLGHCISLNTNCHIRVLTSNLIVLLVANIVGWLYCVIFTAITVTRYKDDDPTEPETESITLPTSDPIEQQSAQKDPLRSRDKAIKKQNTLDDADSIV